MAKKHKKTTIYIKLPPLARSEFEKFMERLGKLIHGDTMVASIEGNVLRINLYGSKLAAERTIKEIRKLVKEYSIGSRILKRYSLKALSREAKTAIPGDVLEEILKYKGYEAEYRGEYVETSASPSIVYEVAMLLGEAIRATAMLHATRTAKKLMLALLVLDNNLKPFEIINIGEALGLIEIDQDGKVHLTMDWRKALKTMIDNIQVKGGE
ncbi:MAG: DUF2067 domain-containing protein [Desulfurococcales archaeon]|nr:DUF2067 domain-containing protein [Desulfurococcales archaeon]